MWPPSLRRTRSTVSRRVQVIGGVRFDRFDLDYHNNRNGDTLGRVDHLVSPRAGVVYKPVEPLSLYGSYSVSYLPSSGDQFSSLDDDHATGRAREIRQLRGRGQVGSAPAWRSRRRSTGWIGPTRGPPIPTTRRASSRPGSQQTNGFELGLNGQLLPGWSMAGGYAYQDASVTSATVSAREGAQVGPGTAPHLLALEQLPASTRASRPRSE